MPSPKRQRSPSGLRGKQDSKLKCSTSDSLYEIEQVTVKMPTGRSVTFDVHEEISIPAKRRQMIEALKKSPEQLAFWTFLVQRQLFVVRRLERELSESTAKANWIARAGLQDHPERDFGYVSDQLVKDVVDQGRSEGASDVLSIREKLDKARHQYGMLVMVRDAVGAKFDALKRLISVESVEDS